MRHKKIEISFELFTEICTAGWKGTAFCAEGLPEGAQLVRTYSDERAGVAVLIYEHESFGNLALGAEIPTLVVSFRTYLEPSE